MSYTVDQINFNLHSNLLDALRFANLAAAYLSTENIYREAVNLNPFVFYKSEISWPELYGYGRPNVEKKYTLNSITQTLSVRSGSNAFRISIPSKKVIEIKSDGHTPLQTEIRCRSIPEFEPSPIINAISIENVYHLPEFNVRQLIHSGIDWGGLLALPCKTLDCKYYFFVVPFLGTSAVTSIGFSRTFSCGGFLCLRREGGPVGPGAVAGVRIPGAP